jgi:UDP-N-acetylmuramoylalanine--D-glutamate ligase
MNTSDKIGIFGGGIEGVAVAEYLLKKGCIDVTLFDEKDVTDAQIPAGIKTIFGAGAFEKTDNINLIFRSPGVKLQKCESARKKGIKITSTTQYFFENCPCEIIGVTGTKGKGTTSTLIYLIMKEAGKDAYIGGNIGESPLNFLDKLKADSIVIMELSSFQLQDLTISPHIAIVLMTTSEHLNYHKDTAEYRAAKSPIVKYQKPEDLTILNRDYDYWKSFAEQTPARKIFVSMNDFEGDGAHIDNDIINTCSRGRCTPIAPVNKVALIGKHNLENIMPVALVARYLKVPIPIIQKVIFSFTGLPHRLEFVREVNGVKYYEDSFSTTPETSVAAVYAFTKPVILIAGGSEKNSDYSEWATKLQQNPNLKNIILMGITADRMEKELRAAAEKLGKDHPNIQKANPLSQFPQKIYRVANLESALKKATELAAPEDNIVMSPAAASFDMFKNYKARGDKFKELVNAL